MSALHDIEQAFRALPAIESVRRRPADDLIPREMWSVKLVGGWLGEHYGTGDTLPAAYADALSRCPERSAA